MKEDTKKSKLIRRDWDEVGRVQQELPGSWFHRHVSDVTITIQG